jgi:hypothetical protein
MPVIYVLRAPAGVLILGSSTPTISSNATFTVRKGNAMLEARGGEASVQIRKGDATFTEGK